MTPRYPLLTASWLFAVTTATATAEPIQEGDNPWRWTMQAGAIHQAEASLDTGGDLSVNRFFVSGGAARMFASRWRVSAVLGYGEDHYDFSGSSGLGGLDPWNRIRAFRISVPVQYFANEQWTVYAIPSLRFNAETDASLSDGRNGGLIAGAAYRVGETLSIGPGFGVFSEIEDDVSFFPILLVDWKITDTLSLGTGSGFAASQGPGLQLQWQYSPRWQFALGGRYEKTRFRLDDSGPAPGGVGQDEAIPLFAMADFAVSRNAKLGLIAGAEVGASLRLEDASGHFISDSDLTTAPFFGATFQARF